MSARDNAAPILGSLLTIAIAVAVIGGGVAVWSWETVDEGHEKVRLVKGESDGTLTPGTWYFENPMTNKYKSVNMRPQLYEMVRAGGEGDKADRDDSVKVVNAEEMEVPVDVAVTYEVTDAEAFYEQWRTMSNAERKLIRNPAREVVYTVGGNMTTKEMTSDSGRTRMRTAVEQRLAERFSNHGSGVKLIGVAIRGVYPPRSYLNAQQQIKVEQKRAEAAQHKAQREIELAQGDAKANRIRDRSLTDAVLAEKQISALEQADTVYVPVGQNGLPTYIDVGANGTQNATGNASA